MFIEIKEDKKQINQSKERKVILQKEKEMIYVLEVPYEIFIERTGKIEQIKNKSNQEEENIQKYLNKTYEKVINDIIEMPTEIIKEIIMKKPVEIIKQVIVR